MERLIFQSSIGETDLSERKSVKRSLIRGCRERPLSSCRGSNGPNESKAEVVLLFITREVVSWLAG